MIAETVPTPEIVDVAVAFVLIVIPIPAKIVPIPAVTPIETDGADVYPEPPSEITILVIVPPAETIAVAAAPVLTVLSRIRTLCLDSTKSSTSLKRGTALSTKTSVEDAPTLFKIYAVGLIPASSSVLSLVTAVLFTNTSESCFFQVTGLSRVGSVEIPTP